MNTWLKEKQHDRDYGDDEHDESSWSWWCWWWNLIYISSLWNLYVKYSEIMSVNLVHATSSMKTHLGGAHWQMWNRSALTTERENSFGQGHTMYEWYTEKHILQDDGHSKVLKNLENLQILHRMQSKSRDCHEWWTQHWSTISPVHDSHHTYNKNSKIVLEPLVAGAPGFSSQKPKHMFISRAAIMSISIPPNVVRCCFR